MNRLVASLRLVPLLKRTAIAAAAALMLAGGYLAVGTTVARADGGAARPGITTVQVNSNGGVVTFTTYPNMASCEAAFLTDCFEFTDGTVEGMLNPLVLLDEAGKLLPPSIDSVFNSPTVADLAAPCITLPVMGSSDAVMDVSNGTTETLLLNKGSCTELKTAVANGVVSRIVDAETERHIKPLDPLSLRNVARNLGIPRQEAPDFP